MSADRHLRILIAVFLLAVSLLSCGGEPAPKAGTHTVVRLPGAVIDGYLIWIPEEYDPSRTWPVLLALGEAGWREEPSSEEFLVGPSRVVETVDREDLAFLRRRFLILSPRFAAPETEGPWEERADQVMELLDEVIRAYRGDDARVYLTGTGGGKCGAWVCLERHAGRFAAAAPLGGFVRASRICFESIETGSGLADLPLWIVRNDGDPAAPSKRLIETVRRIEALGGERFVRIDDLRGLREAPRARRILSIRTPEASRARDLYESPHLYRWMLRWERKNRPERDRR